MEHCARCGTPPSPDDRFCRECGGYLAGSPTFDDLEPPGSARADDDTPPYGLDNPVQFSGPGIPAIDDGPQSPPTISDWVQPTPYAAFEEPGPRYDPPPYGGGPVPFEESGPRYDPPPYGGGPVPFDEPDADRPERRRGRSLLVVGGALVLVVLLTVGLVAVLTDGDDAESAATSSSSPVASGRSSGSSPSPSANTPQAQAKAVDDLLGRAAGGKSLLATAYEQATNCEITPAVAERKFEDAAKNRRAIVKSARKLDTSKLDGGPKIKSLLISMYGTSAKADDAFAAWARAAKNSGEDCLSKNAKRVKGNNLSIKAGKAKRKFVKVWNPVAEQYGYDKRTKDGL